MPFPAQDVGQLVRIRGLAAALIHPLTPITDVTVIERAAGS